MKKKIIILIIAVMATACFANAQVKDIPGYKNTKWGMTEQEIKDAMKDEAIPLKSRKKMGLNCYSTIGMKNISIDSNDYIGYFLMDNTTDRLSMVNFEIIAQDIDDNYDSFNSMVKHLTAEYGKPTAYFTSIYPGAKTPIAKVVWMFPSTILLYMSWGKDLDRNMLQFIENNGKRTLESLGFIPNAKSDKKADSKEEPKEEPKKTEEKK